MSSELKAALEEFTDIELEQELKRREKEREIPKPLEQPNFEGVRMLCINHIEAIANDERIKDDEHYIFEAAMVAVYGSDIWHWYNQNYDR